MENETFVNGVIVGIGIHQKAVLDAHERNEPIKIGDDLFYLQSGRERLQETIDKICR